MPIKPEFVTSFPSKAIMEDNKLYLSISPSDQKCASPAGDSKSSYEGNIHYRMKHLCGEKVGYKIFFGSVTTQFNKDSSGQVCLTAQQFLQLTIKTNCDVLSSDKKKPISAKNLRCGSITYRQYATLQGLCDSHIDRKYKPPVSDVNSKDFILSTRQIVVDKSCNIYQILYDELDRILGIKDDIPLSAKLPKTESSCWSCFCSSFFGDTAKKLRTDTIHRLQRLLARHCILDLFRNRGTLIKKYAECVDQSITHDDNECNRLLQLENASTSSQLHSSKLEKRFTLIMDFVTDKKRVYHTELSHLESESEISGLINISSSESDGKDSKSASSLKSKEDDVDRRRSISNITLKAIKDGVAVFDFDKKNEDHRRLVAKARTVAVTEKTTQVSVVPRASSTDESTETTSNNSLSK